MGAVRRFVEGFNLHEVAYAREACADHMTIIDDFAPYAWSGTDAMLAWSRDMDGMATAYGMSDWSVAPREPRTELVSEHNAYVVVPIDVRWLEQGAEAERRGFMTMSLRMQGDEWRISALAWTWT
jgi:hypothetical protein